MSERIEFDRPGARFVLRDGDDVLGWIDVREDDDELVLVHTEVAEGRQGQGVAGRLAAGVLDAVRDETRRVVVECPYVQGYLAKHPEIEGFETR